MSYFPPPPPPDSPETTQDERTMATLAHALQLVGSWIAPLIIFLIRRQSRFVAFHALQALLLQILHTIFILVFVFGFFILFLTALVPHMGRQDPAVPAAMLVFIPLFWLVLIALSITTLVIAILYAIKAGRGEWADYPVLGKLARKILKMGPAPRA